MARWTFVFACLVGTVSLARTADADEHHACGLNYQWCCGMGAAGQCVRAYECIGGIVLDGCQCCLGYGYYSPGDPFSPLVCHYCADSSYVFDIYCPPLFQVCELCTDTYECTSDDDCPSGTHCQDRLCRAACALNSTCGPEMACNERIVHETDERVIIDEIAVCDLPLTDECEDEFDCQSAQLKCDLVDGVHRCVPRCGEGEWYDWPLEATTGQCCSATGVGEFDDEPGTVCCPAGHVFDGTICCPPDRWGEGSCCPEGTTVDRLGTCCTDAQRNADGDCDIV